MNGWPDTLLEVWAVSSSMHIMPVIVVYFVLYVASGSNMGVLGWIPVVALLAPLACKSYRILRKKVDHYMTEICSSRKGCSDIDKALEDYVDILKRQQRTSRDSGR